MVHLSAPHISVQKMHLGPFEPVHLFNFACIFGRLYIVLSTFAPGSCVYTRAFFAHSDLLFSFYRALCPAEHLSTWGTCAFGTWGTCAFGTWDTCAFGTWAPVHLAPGTPVHLAPGTPVHLAPGAPLHLANDI
jgi:hypothetical protein